MQVKTKTRTTRLSRTDWKRIDAMRDEDIDYSDIPELGPDFFANAVLWRPKEEGHKREADVLKGKVPKRPSKKELASTGNATNS
jgi:hypothetical protein